MRGKRLEARRKCSEGLRNKKNADLEDGKTVKSVSLIASVGDTKSETETKSDLGNTDVSARLRKWIEPNSERHQTTRDYIVSVGEEYASNRKWRQVEEILNAMYNRLRERPEHQGASEKWQQGYGNGRAKRTYGCNVVEGPKASWSRETGSERMEGKHVRVC